MGKGQMSRATTSEIFDSYQGVYPGRVHHQQHVPFGGAPGHIYFVHRRPTPQLLAQITHRSRNAEVACYRINDAFILSIGSSHVANVTLVLPPASERSNGIEEVEWIAHTHPLEQDTAYEGVALGAHNQDRRALERLHSTWGQTSSVVVVCRGGHVVRTVEFRPGE